MPRDELGRIIKPKGDETHAEDSGHDDSADDEPESTTNVDESSSSTSQVAQSSKPTDWEELEDDVMKQLGLEKIAVHKRSKRKRPDIPSALVNVRKKPETSITRLQKRIADPKLKRVVEKEMSYQQSIKYRDKKTMSWGR